MILKDIFLRFINLYLTISLSGIFTSVAIAESSLSVPIPGIEDSAEVAASSSELEAEQAVDADASSEETSSTDYSSHGAITCSLEEGYKSCEKNFDCAQATQNLTVESYTVTVNDNEYTLTEKLKGGEECIHNDVCLSASCKFDPDYNQKQCTDIGFCGSCVPAGAVALTTNTCCPGTIYNKTDKTCDRERSVSRLSSDQEGKFDKETCEFEYTPEQQEFMDDYLQKYDMKVVSFMYLFSDSDDSSEELWINHGDGNKVSEKSKVYRNSYDYFPFYSNKSYKGSGKNKGSDRRIKGQLIKWSSQKMNKKKHRKVKGLAEISSKLKSTRQTGLDDFIVERDRLAEKLNLDRGRFIAGSASDELNEDKGDGGEAGHNYWQSLLDFYTAIQTYESGLADSYGSSVKDLEDWMDMYDTLGGMDFDKNDYRPQPCRGKKEKDSSGNKKENKYHLITTDKRNCVAELWKVHTNTGKGTGLFSGSHNWLVDPVFKLTGGAINKLRKKNGKKRWPKKGLNYIYNARHIRNFRSIVRKDIKGQLEKCANGALPGCDKDNYLAEYKGSLGKLRDAIWLDMIGWGGLYSHKEKTSAWIEDSTGGDVQTWADNRSSLVQSFGDFFDWNDRNEFEVMGRSEVVEWKKGKEQGGILPIVKELEAFYVSSVDARTKSIACLVDKLRQMDDDGGTDYRGASGATKYDNQDGETLYGSGSVDDNCPPSSTDCGANRKNVDSDFNFSLGTKSITGTSGSSGSSLSGLDAISAKVASLSSKNAIRKSALKSAQAAQEKAHGSAYSVQSASQVRTVDSALSAILKKSKRSSESGSSTSGKTTSMFEGENLLAEDSTSEDGSSGDGSGEGDGTKGDQDGVIKAGGSGKGSGGSNGRSRRRRRRSIMGSRKGRGIASGSESEGGDDSSNSNLTGMSPSEVRVMLSRTNDEEYKRKQQDTIFDIVHKRYVRSGYPKLLKRKKLGSFAEEQIGDGRTPSQTKDNGFSPWMHQRNK